MTDEASKKGDGTHLPERPEGCFAQMGPVPFFAGGSESSQESLVSADTVMPRQRLLWQRGDQVRVEAMLEFFPALSENREAVLDLINHEIVLRGEFGGPRPKLEDYVKRFPDFAHDLEMLFEVHYAIEGQGEDETTIYSGSPPPAPTEYLPQLPYFTVEGTLGEGGMGVVYKAMDHRLKRIVALKMIKAGGGQEERDRFQSEAEAVAKLDHPHIVHIFEVNEYQRQPYFALEFADGGSLTRLLKSEPQPAAFAAQLTQTLARAVHYAHSQGIIHRDLKPGNILLQKVTLAAAETAPLGLVVKDGTAYLPKVADFGLAKHVQPDSQVSQSQGIVGTPSYMAPEQAGGFGRKIGPPADVYALGAMLYEMIVGRPPFRGESVLETLDQVRRLDPVPPSRLQPRCPRDLDTICLKCLKKDPAARYATALELADDLGRFLRREPILARPTSKIEHVHLWCRRNPRVAVLSASLLAVVLVSLATVTVFWQRAARGEASAYAHLYTSQINLGQRYWQEVQCQRLTNLLETLRKPPPGQRDLRDFEWYYLNGLLHQDLTRLPGRDCVAFSPDGQILATAGPTDGICLWPTDAARPHQPLRQWQAHGRGLTSVAFDKSGTMLLTGSMDQTAKLWRVTDGTLLKTLDGHDGGVTSVAIDSTGTVLATASFDKMARLWDADGSLRLILDGHDKAIKQVVFSPDGKLLASAGDDFKVRLWDVATGDCLHVLHGHTAEVLSVAFAPDGITIASGGQDGSLHLWDVANGKLLWAMPPTLRWIQCVTFRPDGKRLAAACWETAYTIHIWDIEPDVKKSPGKAKVVLKGHIDRVMDLAFHPTEPRLASVGKDNSVRIWNADRDPEARVIPLDGKASAFALHPLQPLAAVVIDRFSIRLCDLESGTYRAFPTQKSEILSVAWSHDGRWLASAATDGKIGVWEPATEKPMLELTGHTGEVKAVMFHPQSPLLVSAGEDGTVRFWDPESGKSAGQAQTHRDKALCLAFSPDGNWLCSGGKDRVLQIWNLAANRLERTIPDVGKVIGGLALSPDGSQAAVSGDNSVVALWDWRQQKQARSLEGHGSGYVEHVLFSRSGARLVTAGGGDGNLRLWDLTTGQELLIFKGEGEVVGMAFDRQDHTLVTVSNRGFRGHIFIWDSRAGR